MAIGEFNYTVAGSLIQGAAGVEKLDLSVSSGRSVVASIRVYSLPGGGFEMNYAGSAYALPAEFAKAWAALLSLTPADLDGTKQYRRAAKEGGESWESVTPIAIRPDFPAKLRFVYPERGDDDRQKASRPSEIVIWSLEEWNNCFNKNVVLRLAFPER